MKKFTLLLFFCFFFGISDVQAQTKKSGNRNLKSKNVKTAKKLPKIISRGVINSSAIDLVKPDYPPGAGYVGASGAVNIQILIDEYGNVVAAKAVSGNPLLHSASIKAALQSKFNPLILSGEAVRVSGTIVYNYILCRTLNWLEVGYALGNDNFYYPSNCLEESFPIGYEEEKQIINQWIKATENQEEIFEIIVASFRGKLINDEKAFWLFEVGLVLAEIEQNCCWVDEEMQDLASQIKIHLQSKPRNVSSNLISNLEKFVLLAENPNLNNYNVLEENQIYKILKDLKERFSYLGR
jgi:hypothetical protein